MWSKNQIGEKITINGFWETKEESVFVTDKIENIIKDKINLSEISILFRVAAHTRSFEERLINLGLLYKIIEDDDFMKERNQRYYCVFKINK